MQKRKLVCKAMKEHGISKRRACNIFNTSRKVISATGVNFLTKEEKVIKDLALKHPHYGYRMITALLRLRGIICNHKKVYRIYKKLNLHLKRNKKSRKIPARKRILEIANDINQIWSLDFMSSSIKNKRFRTVNIIDEYNREGLNIKADYQLPSKKVINVLEEIISDRKQKPLAIRIDNGSEFTSHEFTIWANNKNITLFYIQAGKPYQNCYIERFNGTYRKEVLNNYIFDSITEVQEITDQWLHEYNYKRPHSSLGGLPPKVFVKDCKL